MRCGDLLLPAHSIRKLAVLSRRTIRTRVHLGGVLNGLMKLMCFAIDVT